MKYGNLELNLEVRVIIDFIFKIIKNKTINEAFVDGQLDSLEKRKSKLEDALHAINKKIIEHKVTTYGNKCDHVNCLIEEHSEYYGCDWDGYDHYKGVKVTCDKCDKSGIIEFCTDSGSSLYGKSNIKGEINLIENFSLIKEIKEFEEGEKLRKRLSDENLKIENEKIQYLDLHNKYGGQ